MVIFGGVLAKFSFCVLQFWQVADVYLYNIVGLFASAISPSQPPVGGEKVLHVLLAFSSVPPVQFIALQEVLGQYVDPDGIEATVFNIGDKEQS